MAQISFDGQQLSIRLDPIEKIGALHGDVAVPLAAIQAVRAVDRPFAEIRGIRAPGTGWPRRIALGTWRRRGSRDFVSVRRNEPGMVVELDSRATGFSRLVLSDAGAPALVDAIEAARLRGPSAE